jgi:hypothetical protein
MVMTMAKITAGDGYLYLTRHTANGDAEPEAKRDAAAYYAAQVMPPGRWTGRGAPLLGLDGQLVTEDQMRNLFGSGMHPDADAMVAAYFRAHPRRGKAGEQSRERLIQDAIKHATLGRPFRAYEALAPFDDRVAHRLAEINKQAHRDPTWAEAKRVKADEARAVAGFDLVFSPLSRPPCCGPSMTARGSATRSARPTRRPRTPRSPSSRTTPRSPGPARTESPRSPPAA